MTDRQRLIDYALSQIGIAEDPLGSNKQKYGAYLDSTDWYLYKDSTHEWRHLVNGYDWCTQFVDASCCLTFSVEKARQMLYRPKYNNMGAVVKYAFNYFKAAGKGFTKEEYTPKAGDIIYFQNSKGLSHTGIVVDVTASQVITVEGNSGKNNWYVAKSKYSKTSSYIYGYGCPDFEETPSKYPTPPFKVEILKSGITGMRAEGWSSSKWLGNIDAGIYTITDLNNDFGLVKEKNAWIYLEDSNVAINPDTPKSMDGYTVGDIYHVVCTEPLTVRTAASTKADVVTSLTSGTSVVCKALAHDDAGNTWMRIDKPVAGWICCIFKNYYVK